MFKDRILIQKIQEETMVYEETLIDNWRIEITADAMLVEVSSCYHKQLAVLKTYICNSN
jgi:hypothetical protein